ncbi:unnamed protein product [Protopolystoma xenopodis]|uniref:CUB domain-containing protein n=1 Tax=Protopolystoma xenopodis TaxID=117903 RepID=A0A448X0K8_9PLAT|nr:unnamed protein product [Protopolystoma xenopodis]
MTFFTAPENDQYVRLSFREFFIFEYKQGCRRDFLEIRDGQFGFSRLIARLCNRNEAQNDVVSTGQFMWLRFRSDSSINHKGFKAVYWFPRHSTRSCIEKILVCCDVNA